MIEDPDFEEWIDNRFDLDPMIIAIIYKIYGASQNKRTAKIGVIVELEPEPIEEKEIATLALHLMEKGLQFKRKRDTL